MADPDPFFVIERETRRVTIAGIHPQPYGAWMEQLARNLTDPVEGCLRTAALLIHDRDPLYTRVFGEILTGGGVQPIRLPPKSPNLNAYAERFVRSIKEECLRRVVPLGEAHVRQLVHEFVEHDHHERNHQGRDNQLLQRPPPPVNPDADVERRERLGGLLSFYYREAARGGGSLSAPLRPRGCRESTARPQQRGGWALTAYLGTLLVFQASKRARLRVLRANSSVVDTSPCSEVYVPAFGKRTSVTARSAQRQVPA